VIVIGRKTKVPNPKTEKKTLLMGGGGKKGGRGGFFPKKNGGSNNGVELKNKVLWGGWETTGGKEKMRKRKVNACWEKTTGEPMG